MFIANKLSLNLKRQWTLSSFASVFKCKRSSELFKVAGQNSSAREFGAETVKTVDFASTHSATPLKRGVNENVSYRRFLSHAYCSRRAQVTSPLLPIPWLQPSFREVVQQVTRPEAEQIR